jgi:hypothetical protein
MAGEKGNVFINDFLKLIFNATAIANIADNAATAPLTNLYVSLHTADPTAAGTQSSNEAAYTSYARIAVARSSAGWTVTAQTVVPASPITFPACIGGTSTVTYFGIGTLSTGAGKLLYAGPVTPNMSVSTGVTPQLTTSTSITEA